MALLNVTSPHTRSTGTTGTVMLTVLLATIPGILALTAIFGMGTLINVALASAFAVGFEAAVLKLRNRPVVFFLKDYSAIVTAVLLGLALPPYVPWWIIAVGIFFAIVVAKHLYGGLGFNPFNPAMVGYVVLLISFPIEMSLWAAPLTESNQTPGLMDALGQVFSGNSINGVDGYTAATPLDVIRQNSTLLIEDLYAEHPAFASAQWAGTGWEWVNIAFLLGGVFLLYKKYLPGTRRRACSPRSA